MDNLDDLKAAIREHWERGKQIISHFKRLEEEYSDWEDGLVELERQVDEYAEENGVSKEELIRKPAKEPKPESDIDISDLL